MIKKSQAHEDLLFRAILFGFSLGVMFSVLFFCLVLVFKAG